MTNDPLDNALRELSWRRKLSPPEEAQVRAWLAAHPEAQAEWETEAELNEALGRLPDVAVATNFTARVLQAVESELASTARRRRLGRFWSFPWLVRASYVTVILAAGVFCFHYVREAHRLQSVKGVVTISEIASLPSPQALEDFDAIRLMGKAPPADEELLKLLQ